MPLKLSLRPNERFVINGAVLQNGERRSVLMLQNQASVLREKDILQPEEATTPARRVYFPIMMLYLSEGDMTMLESQARLRLSEFAEAVLNPEARRECADIGQDLNEKQFYKALSRCRRLIAYEDSVLGKNHVDSRLPTGSQTG